MMAPRMLRCLALGLLAGAACGGGGGGDAVGEPADASPYYFPEGGNAAGDGGGGAGFPGTRISARAAAIVGVSADGAWTAYSEGETLFAAPTGGGDEIELGDALVLAFFDGNALVIYEGDFSAGGYDLSIWLPGAEAPERIVGDAWGDVGVAPDLAHLWFTRTNDDGDARIVVSEIDGSAAETIAPDVWASSGCRPRGGFLGDGALVLSYCPAQSGPDDPRTVLHYAIGGEVEIVDDAARAWVTLSPTGDAFAYARDGQAVRVMALDGAVLAEDDGDEAVSSILFTPDGETIVYPDDRDQIRALAVAGGFAAATIAEGVDVAAISPEGARALVATRVDGNGFAALVIAALDGGDTLTLEDGTEAAASGFTTDGAFVVWRDDAAEWGNGYWTYSVRARATGGEGEPVRLAERAWPPLLAADGRIVVVADINPRDTSGRLVLASAATGEVETLADGVFLQAALVPPDGRAIVYSVVDPEREGDDFGVYVLALP